MTPAQVKSLIKTLKESGVTTFEHGDLKLSFAKQLPHAVAKSESPKEVIPLDAATEAGDPIKHKVEEMVGLMKLSDAELVDRLFPDTEAKEESA